MGYADIEFNNILGSSLQIYAMKYPNIPATSERITESEVPGRDGKLHKRSGNYNPTEISVDFNYIGNQELWNERWREAKKWLSAHNVKLKFADDPNYFYKVSHVILATNERVSRRAGKFNATFVTKDGLLYLEEGTNKIDISLAKNNPGIVSHPEYYIEGDGICVLKVNGKEMTANVSGNIIINTELMISYQEDKTNQNVAVTGEYENLYLLSGKNDISITDGFTCQVVPNWRCL